MSLRTGIITMKGNPLTLSGTPVQVGDVAPDFTVLDNGLSPVTLKESLGKKVIISVVPSVDTSVCAAQTRRFNEEAARLNDVVIYTISADLPFALGRFCAAEGIDAVKTLSDHKDLSFGLNYGFVIDELRILSRGILVISPEGRIVHLEIVPEVTNHPDYDAALAAINNL